METHRLVVYEAIATPQLSDTLIEQLRRRQLDAVTFMSPRAANIFTTLLAKAGAQRSHRRPARFLLKRRRGRTLAGEWLESHPYRR